MTNCESVYDEGYAEKNGMKMYFVDGLMYGAIFADKGVYDCNVKRLMFRVSEVSGVLADKADLMNSRGCNTNLKADMVVLAGLAGNATVDDIVSLNQYAKDIGDENDREVCGLW